ncbi:MAG: sigma-54 dependent transcriptional regulator [Chitinophagaceae bacterium]
MPEVQRKILIIDDDPDLCTLLSKYLGKNGYNVDIAFSGSKGIEKIKEARVDLVICDYRLGDREGKDVLIQIKKIDPSIKVLIITGYSDIKTAVDVIKLGAFDYITKPLIPDEVLSVIKSALQSAPEAKVQKQPSEKEPGVEIPTGDNEFLVGKSGETRELYKQIQIVAPTDYSIILYGESGTGKEVMAKTIHALSKRKDMPFIAMDCGTLSRELAGSELFGHVKGAFTGALADKEGHFEIANGGTLFLDEVANLSYDVQASLLRVIQEKIFKRVGGNKEMSTDVRIIVASNENLQDAYKKGKFREDLYHRFNEFSINLPPLRNRKTDIPLFAKFFLEKTNQELGKNVEGFDEDVMHAFENYSWPGNLREFRNVVRRAVLLTETTTISSKSLPWEITNTPIISPGINGDYTPQAGLFDETGLKDAASRAEYETIMKVLKQVNNNKTKAAEILKIDRKTLYNKIKVYEDAQLK